ncbi:MAG: methyltransferase domain-containing protein [Candidatus Sedimenticola sp. (ex Thyasira tokunagai)]
MSKGNNCNPLPELTKELKQWQKSPLGVELLAQEKCALEQLLPALFGYYLLHIGRTDGLGDTPSCSHIRTVVNLSLDSAGSTNCCGVMGDAENLPFASDSIDAVLLSHTIDFSPDPHRLLREVERVLIPEGKLIILGFNSLSLWGVWRLFHLRRRHVPWCGRFISLPRLDDWLSLLGFEVQQVKRMMFTPPLQQGGIIRRLAMVEQLGGRYWPMLPGAYAVQAVKRVSTLTPIEPAWKLRSRVLGGGVIEPTTRTSSRELGSE